MTAAAVAPAPKQALGASVNIPPRRMDFDFNPAQTTRYYYDNDAFLSTFLTTLSSLFPEGETYFVDAVRAYRDQVKDPVLKAQIAGFIGQEAMHSKEHEAFNNAATAQGYPVDKLHRDVGLLLKFVRKATPKSFQLATTVCLEHYTAIMAEMLLRDPDVQQKFSPEMRQLWMWHALEENEHKNVAYDVYEKLVGNYALRAGAMIPTTVVFFAVAFWFHGRLLASEGKLFDFRNNWRGLKYCWGGRKGVFSRLLPQYLDFFRPGFHPSHHDTEALLDEWREKLFTEGGLLHGKAKKPNGQPLH
ncbi:MAG: metal-dependent hydrolase [Pseudomonadota bacterium]